MTTNPLAYIAVMNGMNACKVTDALANAESLRLPLVQKAIAKAPKCEVSECTAKLNPDAPSGWIIEWFDPKGKHLRTWCCDTHVGSVETLYQSKRSGLSEPEATL
jgi:hypothetical protein